MPALTRSRYRTPQRRANAIAAIAGAARHVSRWRGNALVQAVERGIRRQLDFHRIPYTVGAGAPRVPVRNRQSSKKTVTSTVGSAKYVKRGKRVTKQSPYKVSTKVEFGANNGAWNAIYVGGTTHPSQPTVRTICQSIVRFLAIRAKVDFGNWSDFCSMPASGGSAFFVCYWVQTVPGLGVPAAMTLQKVSSNGKTWLQLADSLADSMISTLDSAVDSLRITAVGLQQDISAAAPIPLMQSQFYLAEDLYITVKGESAIQVQNRTPGDDANNGSLDAENIFANPLRGKYYTCKGGKAIFRDPENTSASNASYFVGDPVHGTIGAADRFGGTVGTPSAGTSLYSPPVENSLTKPPPGGFFSNVSTTKYMSVKPGEILRSKMVREYTFKLSRWIDVLKTKFVTNSFGTLNGLGLQADPFEYKLGSCHFYGLEKMCDTVKAASPGFDRIKVGIEHNLFMSGHCRYKPKFGVAPLVNIRTV